MTKPPTSSARIANACSACLRIWPNAPIGLALVLAELVAGLGPRSRPGRPCRPRRPGRPGRRAAQVVRTRTPACPEFSQSKASASGIETVPPSSSASVSPKSVIPTIVDLLLAGQRQQREPVADLEVLARRRGRGPPRSRPRLAGASPSVDRERVQVLVGDPQPAGGRPWRTACPSVAEERHRRRSGSRRRLRRPGRSRILSTVAAGDLERPAGVAAVVVVGCRRRARRRRRRCRTARRRRPRGESMTRSEMNAVGGVEPDAGDDRDQRREVAPEVVPDAAQDQREHGALSPRTASSGPAPGRSSDRPSRRRSGRRRGRAPCRRTTPRAGRG